MNPYASALGERQAREAIAQTTVELERLTQRLGAEGWNRSLAPGKWTAREIVCHLADTEIAFGFRLRQALAEPHHTIQPFDQDAWSRAYANLRAQDAVETFSALRRWNIALIDSVPQDSYRKPVTHPERGQMTFQTLVETMGGHDLHHMKQLQQIAAAA